jgi:hypothetical protein
MLSAVKSELNVTLKCCFLRRRFLWASDYFAETGSLHTHCPIFCSGIPETLQTFWLFTGEDGILNVLSVGNEAQTLCAAEIPPVR